MTPNLIQDKISWVCITTRFTLSVLLNKSQGRSNESPSVVKLCYHALCVKPNGIVNYDVAQKQNQLWN